MPSRTLDGTKIYDPETGLLIPFKSHSDALLAQLPLQHGMSKQHFNLLLDILLDPSFSLAELNLKSATDVDVQVSDYRRELAEERCQRTGNSVKSSCALDPAGVPSIVFDLVLEQLLAEMDHFSYEANTIPTQSFSLTEETTISETITLQMTLKCMSLVHRTWTEPTQRALRRRIILTSRRTLRVFARSPACGTGVREFAYKIPKSETCTFFHESNVAREHWTTLASVVSRLTTLRYLCVSIESAHLSDLNGLELVLGAIESLKSLEGLWLLSARDHCPYFPKLCSTISKLPSLRFLSVWNWTCPRKPEASDALPGMREKILDLTPPPRLKALQMRDDYLTTPLLYLAWLFQPRGSYSLDSLDLHITFSRPLPFPPLDPAFPNHEGNYTTPHIDSSHLLAALAPLLPTLTTLAIKLFYLDTSTASGAFLYDTDMQALLERCTSLRRIRLHRLRAGTHVDGVRLPLVFPQVAVTAEAGARAGSASASVIDLKTQAVRLTRLSTSLVLPPTLEELHMHYMYSAINWRTQDLRLFGTLRSSDLPCLKRVLVSNGETDLEGGKGRMVDPKVDLPKTSELCEKLGVELLALESRGVHRYVIDTLS